MPDLLEEAKRFAEAVQVSQRERYSKEPVENLARAYLELDKQHPFDAVTEELRNGEIDAGGFLYEVSLLTQQALAAQQRVVEGG